MLIPLLSFFVLGPVRCSGGEGGTPRLRPNRPNRDRLKPNSCGSGGHTQWRVVSSNTDCLSDLLSLPGVLGSRDDGANW